MQKQICGIIVASMVILLLSCSKGFEGSEVFKRDFEHRSELFAATDYLSIFTEELSIEQREALQFM